MSGVKKNVFSAVLKLSKDGELREVHAVGPATTNARPPNFVLVRWTTRSPRADDRKAVLLISNGLCTGFLAGSRVIESRERVWGFRLSETERGPPISRMVTVTCLAVIGPGFEPRPCHLSCILEACYTINFLPTQCSVLSLTCKL